MAGSVPKSSRLIERLDYYVEDGKVVFTAHYLLKRGFCCNKGCRHCPYNGADAPLLSVRIVGLEGIDGSNDR